VEHKFEKIKSTIGSKILIFAILFSPVAFVLIYVIPDGCIFISEYFINQILSESRHKLRVTLFRENQRFATTKVLLSIFGTKN